VNSLLGQLSKTRWSDWQYKSRNILLHEREGWQLGKERRRCLYDWVKTQVRKCRKKCLKIESNILMMVMMKHLLERTKNLNRFQICVHGTLPNVSLSFFSRLSVCLSIHSPWSFFFFFYFSFFPFPLNVIAQLIISFSKKKERNRVDKFQFVRLLPIYVFKLSFVLQIEFGRKSSEYLVFSSWNRTMRPHFICCCMA